MYRVKVGYAYSADPFKHKYNSVLVRDYNLEDAIKAAEAHVKEYHSADVGATVKAEVTLLSPESPIFNSLI